MGESNLTIFTEQEQAGLVAYIEYLIQMSDSLSDDNVGTGYPGAASCLTEAYMKQLHAQASNKAKRLAFMLSNSRHEKYGTFVTLLYRADLLTRKYAGIKILQGYLADVEKLSSQMHTASEQLKILQSSTEANVIAESDYIAKSIIMAANLAQQLQTRIESRSSDLAVLVKTYHGKDGNIQALVAPHILEEMVVLSATGICAYEGAHVEAVDTLIDNVTTFLRQNAYIERNLTIYKLHAQNREEE